MRQRNGIGSLPATPQARPPFDRHQEALRTSSELTTIFRRMYQREAMMITPEAIIQILNQAGVKFVLMGTHGIGGWRDQPRATQDVDVLVSKKHHRKAVAAVRLAFPDLTIQEAPVVTRFLDPTTNQPLIDLMKPSAPLLQQAFRNVVLVGDTHFVPDLEMALASKFAAMISPHRLEDKKLIDAGDFVNMVRTNAAAINRRRLRSLGEKVYSGGGDEVLRLVEDVRAGRRIQF